MKKLTIEEKAQAYDKAIINGSRLWECGEITRESYEYIFPELKESGDERIRKRIIHALHGDVLDMEETTEAIAWLEKQGDQEQLYIRFGEIPTDEKSKIFQGEIEIGTENGVSVYPAFKTSEGDIVLGLSLPITKTTLYTQQHLIEYDDRPCYLVKGDYVGKDTDGQPLINNVSIIEKIDTYRVKEKKQGEQKVSYTTIVETGNGGINALVTKELPTNSCDDANYCSDCINKKGYINCENGDMKETEHKVEPKFHEGDWVVYNNDICQIVKREEGCNKLITIFGIEKELVNERNLSTARLWTIKDAKDGDVLATDDGNIFVFDGTVEDDKYPFAYYGLTRRRFESYDRRLPFTHNNIHPATKEQRDQLEKAMADAGYTFDFEKKELRKIEQKFAEWSEEDENRFNNLIFLVECSDENEPTKKGFIDFINRLKFTSHQKYGSRVMSREDLLNKLEEIQTEYKRRMHDAQAKEDYIYASGLCDSISRVIKIVKED